MPLYIFRKEKTGLIESYHVETDDNKSSTAIILADAIMKGLHIKILSDRMSPKALLRGETKIPTYERMMGKSESYLITIWEKGADFAKQTGNASLDRDLEICRKRIRELNKEVEGLKLQGDSERTSETEDKVGKLKETIVQLKNEVSRLQQDYGEAEDMIKKLGDKVDQFESQGYVHEEYRTAYELLMDMGLSDNDLDYTTFGDMQRLKDVIKERLGD